MRIPFVVAGLIALALWAAPRPQAQPVVTFAFDSDDDPALVAEVKKVAGSLVQEFPILRGSVYTSEVFPPYLSDTFAYASQGKVAINDEMAGNLLRLDFLITLGSRMGHHPPLGRCSTVEYLVYHETAHLLDQATGRVAHYLVWLEHGDGNELRGQLSTYSFGRYQMNYSEALADAFASVRCNGGNAVERNFYFYLTGRVL